MADSIAATWAIQGRIVVYLLAGIADEALGDAAGGKGRTVADHFAHVHNVRLMWLKSAAPERLESLDKLEKVGVGAAARAALIDALTASSAQIEDLLADAETNGTGIRGFKPNATAFACYLVAHESYHIGKIDLILRQAGHPVSDKVHYGMWEWGVR